MMALSSEYTQLTSISYALSGATAQFVFWRQHDTHVMAVEGLWGGMLGEACIDIEIPSVELD